MNPERPTRLAAALLFLAGRFKVPAVLFAWIWLGAAEARPNEKRPDARPNIVFILLDDVRWDDLACMGQPFVKQPHIDRLAREGARFTNAYATTPLCSP